MTIPLVLAMILAAGEGAQEAPAKQELQRPADWVTLADPGAAAAAPLYFVSMPPGWHITTGPGTILYDPKKACTGRCRIEAEIYLFPGTSDGGYGVIYSGLHLDAEKGPCYNAVLLRRDGAIARETWIDGKHVPQGRWMPEYAHYVVKGLPDKPVKNVLVIDVDEVDGARVVRFLVNGNEFTREHYQPNLPGHLPHDGTVGLRIDAGMNVHVSRLDVTNK